MADSVTYSYAGGSRLEPRAEGSTLTLATSGGLRGVRRDLVPVAHPFFFSGFVEHPDVVAAALLVVARVARTRYYVPPGMLAALLRAADPVVTSTPEGLRFESFSACCGVYARLDVDSGALDAEHHATGVTNVDVNPPLRQALAGLRPAEPLHLGVGAELRVTTLDAETVEERVPLPNRWLKGFAETQLLGAGMRLRHALGPADLRRFVQSLPKSSATRTVMWATPAVRSLRLASRPTPGAVCVAGPERLRVLEPLVRFATGLRAYGADAAPGSPPLPSGWVLDLPGGSVTVALSPEKSRGFSGEGSVLHALVGDDVTDDADLLSALLAFDPRIDVDRLGAEAALSPDRVCGALGVLASSGQVGFDLGAGAYFHRPLPVATDALGRLHPRLADAHGLVDAGAVTRREGGFEVRSGATTYTVRLTDDPDRCTCPWFAKYRGSHGPCKHVLAARIVAGRESS